MKYIHYGDVHFDYDLFDRVRNFSGNKPMGGLWATPKEPKYIDWKEWCEGNDFNVDRLKYSFEFELSPDAKVFNMSSGNDIYRLHDELNCCEYDNWDWYYYQFSKFPPVEKIDFEMMIRLGYDAFMLWMDPDLYWSMYGWDCDSLLIFNPDCVVEV